MSLKSMRKGAALLAATLLTSAPAAAQEGPKLQIGGTTYTKWLFGNRGEQGSLYNFTTIPGEGYGDNGIGTELELLLNGRLSQQVEVRGRIHSRFSQNFWTNFGGFGGTPGKDCVAGNCGEFDSRSNQYIKLRGLAVTLTPGYLVDSATIGANDFGQFDPFVVGRVRYIDRDNAYGILVQGSALDRRLTWDAARISLPRLWAGPGWSTGAFHATDAAYAAQAKFAFSELFDLGLIGQYTYDSELKVSDTNFDDGVDSMPRYRNAVGGLKAGLHVSPAIDVRGAFYHSYSNTDARQDSSIKPFGSKGGYSPVLYGKHQDSTYMLDVAMNDPLEMGLSLNLQAFSIGSDYVSVMAARRESDVLLTEGHDAVFAMPGPSNVAWGLWGGRGAIGYGGWTSEAQQVATINVDNEFTDFDEPYAETAIGWKGVTAQPVYTNGALELQGEYSYITYNTNWQSWGDDSIPLGAQPYPTMEMDTGVGHSFRSAYTPFQDRNTHLLVGKAKYVLDIGKGIDVFGKVKYLYETDRRINDAKYLPFKPGSCPGDGPCDTTDAGKNFYGSGNTTADLFGQPEWLGNGYSFKPFDDIADDDRELKYNSFNLGAGYQFTDDLYLSLTYGKYLADLRDGNTAFQAYGANEMASGFHDKNQLLLRAKYILAGVEFGFEGQYAFGTFRPNFGEGFVAQQATDGSEGFKTFSGGWNSLEERRFTHARLKAFMKAQF